MQKTSFLSFILFYFFCFILKLFLFISSFYIYFFLLSPYLFNLSFFFPFYTVIFLLWFYSVYFLININSVSFVEILLSSFHFFYIYLCDFFILESPINFYSVILCLICIRYSTIFFQLYYKIPAIFLILELLIISHLYQFS